MPSLFELLNAALLPDPVPAPEEETDTEATETEGTMAVPTFDETKEQDLDELVHTPPPQPHSIPPPEEA